ncbi:DNA-binding protein [Marinobacterium nitratireducens]|uniref:DNA-binding protein n=1 Tax=Marinobacterium nitratireducens TaxID=518897 RepID=A0A917ZG09_9GAMM|nr:H-NS family nucleoid-associated regulatory protein [Marinobacterium nitratireducens]GGO82685.1 DNA-binding protein [Marinobacterium nitratireducens]
MSDFVKNLTRKNSLRKHCQELSVGDIEKALADLGEIIEERKAAEAEMQAELEARKAKIEEIRKQMEAAGIGLDELQALKGGETGKRKVEAKYRITDEEGQVHEWSGRGRTPVVFKEYFEKHGVSKEDTRI